MNDKVMHEAQSYKMSLRNWIEIIKNADKFNLPINRIYSWFFSTSNSSYGDWELNLIIITSVWFFLGQFFFV